MKNDLLDKSILYLCPNCFQQMIGFNFKGIYRREWYCEGCGHKGQHALATLNDKPNCRFWENGFCSRGINFFRNPPLCQYDFMSYGKCHERKEGVSGDGG